MKRAIVLLVELRRGGYAANERLIRGALLALLPALLTACSILIGKDGLDGEDGADGRAYIAYSWVFDPIVFWTDDPGMTGLTYITNGQYRETRPGTYNFAYVAWDDSYWEGSYRIYVNPGMPGEPGEPGGFLHDGANGADGVDGEDIYFELLCLSFGATLYEWTEEFPYLSVAAQKARPAVHSALRESLQREAQKALEQSPAPNRATSGMVLPFPGSGTP